MSNATKPTGVWYLSTKDGQTIAFFHDYEETISPLERIGDFEEGDYWIIDASSSVTGYPEFPEDNSFVMIPKDDVVSVFFEKYTERSKPKVISKTKL